MSRPARRRCDCGCGKPLETGRATNVKFRRDCQKRKQRERMAAQRRPADPAAVAERRRSRGARFIVSEAGGTPFPVDRFCELAAYGEKGACPNRAAVVISGIGICQQHNDLAEEIAARAAERRAATVPAPIVVDPPELPLAVREIIERTGRAPRACLACGAPLPAPTGPGRPRNTCNDECKRQALNAAARERMRRTRAARRAPHREARAA